MGQIQWGLRKMCWCGGILALLLLAGCGSTGSGARPGMASLQSEPPVVQEPAQDIEDSSAQETLPQGSPSQGSAVQGILPVTPGDTLIQEEPSAQEPLAQEAQEGTTAQETPAQEPQAQEETPAQEPQAQEETPAQEPFPQDTPPVSMGRLVVIDAGHQAKGNSEQEPIGPGASQTKAKVTGGTKGCVSGLYEYELTLAVSEKLSAELQSRGYEVLMVRTTHDVDISNAERAATANDAGADAFVRIHANGSDNASVNGVETLCQTKDNPYNAALYEDSKSLSTHVLDGVAGATGAKRRRVVETDTMSGINWCQVPVTIVEMGFMSNETEDALMADEEYQQKLATGIADGIDAYFAEKAS